MIPKITPQVIAIAIGLGLGYVGRTEIARPLIIVGGATLATTIIKNGLIDWLMDNIIYDMGSELTEDGKTLLESTLGVFLTAYFFIAPQSVFTTVATIAIIGFLIWVYIRFASPESILGWIFLSLIVVTVLSFLFIFLIFIFEDIPNIYVWGIVGLVILLLISGLYRDYRKQNIPQL